MVVRGLRVGHGWRSSLLGAEATLGDGVDRLVAVTAVGTSRLDCVGSILAIRWASHLVQWTVKLSIW